MAGRERFRALAALIPRGSRVADIGTDHARLPRILLKTGIASFCIATERSRTSLCALLAGMRSRPVPENLEFRAGDGLAALRPEDRLDVLVLAGMGARTQCRILSSPLFQRLGVGRLVLQPHGDPAVLRRWLIRNRCRIAVERMLAVRKRFQLLLAAEPAASPVAESHPTLSGEDLMVAGPRLVGSADPVARLYWETQRRRLLEVETSAPPGPGRDRAVRDRLQAERVLEAFRDHAL